MLTRVAQARDAAAVAAVQIASWRAAYRGIMPAVVLDGLELDSLTEGWRQRIRNVPRALLVCETDAGILGFAASGASRDDDCDPDSVAEVYAIYVVPDRWGTGAGSVLWAASLVELRAERFREVTVWVLEANARARSFYTRQGLHCDAGAVKRFEAAPGVFLDEVRYRAPL